MTTNATGSLSSSPTKSTYVETRFRPTPRTSPPRTAPSGLSSPPRMAAANGVQQDRPHHVRVEEDGRRHHHPGDRAEHRRRSPSPSASIQPTRTPTSRLASGFDGRRAHGEAELREAEEQQQERDARRARRRSRRSPGSRSATPPTSIARSRRGSGTRASRRPRSRRRPVQADKRPTVTITIATTGARSRPAGSPPARRDAAGERDRERREEGGPVRPARLDQPQAMNVANIAISPWAKLITRVAR